MGVLFSSLGYLVYTLPAAFLVFLLRETVRSIVYQKIGYRVEYNPVYYVDIIAVSCLSLFGISWGGIIHEDREDNWITMLIAQLVYLALFFLIFIYLRLNNPSSTSNAFIVLTTMAKQCYVLFIINFLPIVPFDFSFFYMQKLQHTFGGRILKNITKLIFIILFYFNLVSANSLGIENIYNFIVPGI